MKTFAERMESEKRKADLKYKINLSIEQFKKEYPDLTLFELMEVLNGELAACIKHLQK